MIHTVVFPKMSTVNPSDPQQNFQVRFEMTTLLPNSPFTRSNESRGNERGLRNLSRKHM
jgi:hypothetical protein